MILPINDAYTHTAILFHCCPNYKLKFLPKGAVVPAGNSTVYAWATPTERASMITFVLTGNLGHPIF